MLHRIFVILSGNTLWFCRLMENPMTIPLFILKKYWQNKSYILIFTELFPAECFYLFIFYFSFFLSTTMQWKKWALEKEDLLVGLLHGKRNVNIPFWITSVTKLIIIQTQLRAHHFQFLCKVLTKQTCLNLGPNFVGKAQKISSF